MFTVLLAWINAKYKPDDFSPILEGGVVIVDVIIVLAIIAYIFK